MRSDHAVELSPISDADVQHVAAFLHEHLNPRVTHPAWVSAITPPWTVDSPNYGFLLRHEDVVVGAHLAFYSERVIAGRTEKFCNLAAWCVHHDYRQHSVRLLRALLRQKGYHFTDLSPSGAVVPLNTRLKFESLDTATALIPNLPWPPISRACTILTDAAAIDGQLSGQDRTIYRDHRRAHAAHHLVVKSGEETCYVIYRRDRRKKLPIFASILYVSNPAVFELQAGRVFRHLLLRAGVFVTLAELRVVGSRPRRSWMLKSPRVKMFHSDRLGAGDIDYLYSELVCVSW